MKIEVLCLETKEKIIFNNKYMLFNLENSDFYYKISNNTIHLITSLNDRKLFSLRDKEKVCVVILDEINDKSLLTLKNIYADKRIIIIAGRNNLDDTQYDKSLYKIIYMPQFNRENESINIDHILFMIIENYHNIMNESYAIVGSNEFENISLYILKRFNYICRLKSLYLNIYTEKELDKRELSYIEDPLNEYIEDESMLIIKQRIKKEYHGGIYFSIIGK